MKLEAQKDASDMFGGGMSKNLLEIQLETEDDFVKFSELIYIKIKNTKIRNF